MTSIKKQENTEKQSDKFLKTFAGFFLAVVIFIIMSNPYGIIDGLLDALK